MRDWSAIFDRLDVQTSGLKRRDRTFATTAWAFDTHVDFLDTELDRLVSCLLSGALAGKRRAFSTALETTSSRTGPTKRFAFGVSDRDSGVIKSRLNVSHSISHISSDSSFFVCLCHFSSPAFLLTRFARFLYE